MPRTYCPMRKAHYNRKHRYDLSPATYARMLARQRGVCAICQKPKRLCVDHLHHNGLVRGLLCNACNSLLGHAFDNIKILKRAIAYLRRARRLNEKTALPRTN